MLLIAGLGNPDEEYKETRHNIGYKIVIEVCKKLGFDFLKEANAYRANLYLRNTVEEQDVVFCLPLGYMNNSGETLKQVMNFYGDNAIKDLWVIHDDTEVPFGEVRVKLGGTSGGHNGIKSIDQAIGATYGRFRIGVGRPKNPDYDLADYVLARFTPEEEKVLARIIDQVSSHLLKSIKEGKLTSITFNAKKETTK